MTSSRRLCSVTTGLAIAALASALAGGGDGSSGSSAGGTGGAGTGGTGGTGGTTTSLIAACQLNAEPHVAVVVVGPAGAAIGATAASVTGKLVNFGVDTPPSAECGSGQAW